MKNTIIKSLILLSIMAVSSIFSMDTLADNKVGTPDGQFSVSPLGGAVYSVSIECPKGVGGMEPRLALTYNSQSGYGLAGYGFNLSGLSAITIGPRDLYHDYYTKGLLHDGHDSYYLDGKRLILNAGEYVTDGDTLTVEGDPYTTVMAHGTLDNTTATLWFEVKTPDGMTYRYGDSSNSRLSYTTDSGIQRINTWYVSTAEDANTNFINYYYTNSNYFYRPTLIEYGGNRTMNRSNFNSIWFEYEALGVSAQPFVFDGHKGEINVRLKKVTTKTGTSVYRSYDLAYSTAIDNSYGKFARLTSVTEKNGSGESMNPVTFAWNGLPSVNVAETDLDISFTSGTPVVVIQGTELVSADLNGDGVDEIIRISPVKILGSTQHYYTYVYVSRSHIGQDGTVSYLSPITYEINAQFSLGSIKSLMAGTSVTDYDGDGLNDLFIPYHYSEYGENYLYCRLIYGRDVALGSSQCYSFFRPLRSGSLPLLTTYDVTGDGLSEILYMEKAASGGHYPLKVLYPRNLTDSLADMSFDASLSNAPKKMFSGDYNGDGLTDIIIFHSGGYKIYYNRGGGVTDQKFYEWATASGTNLKDSWRMEQGDFNGDGLTDFLYNTAGSRWLEYALSNGDGTFTCQQAVEMPVAEITNTNKDDNKFSLLVNDLDHDGKSDVVVLKGDYKHHNPLIGDDYYRFDKTYALWYYSTGDSLSLIRSLTTDGTNDGTSSNVTIGDFDGNGCAELLHYGKNIWDTATLDETKLHVYKSGTDMPKRGRIGSITDGLGRATAIGYKVLTNPSVYQKTSDLQYPVIEKTLPLSVVSQVTATNGAAGIHTATYQYRGLKTHVKGKGLLGFSGTTVTDATLGTTVTTDVSQWNNSKYVPTKSFTTTQTGDATATNETIQGVYLLGRNHFACPTTVTDTDADGNVSQTLLTYDTAHGVLLSRRQNHDGGAVYTQTTYSDYVSRGGQRLPQTVTTTQKHSDDNVAYTTVKTLTYDSQGRMLTSTEHAGTPMALTTAFTYDSFGNRLSEVRSGTGVTAVTRHWTYDTSGRFVSTSYTSPATSTLTYTRDTWGNVTQERDMGSSTLTTTYTYDGWGTPLSKTTPEGVVTTYGEGWGTGPIMTYYRMESTEGRPWVKTWYDEWGREMLSESVGPDGTDVRKGTYYDARGNVIFIGNRSGDLIIADTLAYDSRNRLVSDALSTGKKTTYTYGNRSVTTTVNGRAYVKAYDAWGNVKTSTDPVSSVAYTYYSTGLPHTATSEGSTLTMAYDAAGHRTLLDDPDAGAMTSTWSADGKLLSQTDGRNVTTTYTYNTLGLVSTQQTGSMTVTNTYGTNASDQLRLQSAMMGGHTVSYNYDSFDRVVGETRAYADGTTLSFQYGYDSAGHLSQTVYPGGLTIGYSYDSHGYCTAMTANGQTVYTHEYSDGLKDSVAYSGNITRTSIRNASGYVTSDRWMKGASQTLWLTYEYDTATGNLVSRNDPYYDVHPGIVNPRSDGDGTDDRESRDGLLPFDPIAINREYFSYDALDRLTSARIRNVNKTVNYASNGNISFKTSVGNYSYDAEDKPHAVKSVSNPNGLMPTSMLETTYNDIGKISMIEQDDYQTTFSYGPDHERWRSCLTDDGNTVRTVLYGGDYERVVVGDTVREFYYPGHGIIVMKQGSTFTVCVAATDALGSILRLFDQQGNTLYSAYYDAWGVAAVDSNKIAFNRGYTGHEMLPEYGLVNMNGRLYDPQIGRFLSPDNYVQLPDLSQSFNRYSYCLNNPLKYTDPDGEVFVFSFLSGLIKGIGKLVSGHGHWYSPFYEAYKNGANDLKVTWGLLKGSPKQILSRFTWELPQTSLGFLYSSYKLTFHDVDEVRYFDGATYVIDRTDKNNGVTIGSFININTTRITPVDANGNFAPYKDPLFAHEYGHYIQSQRSGWGYLFYYGSPSLFSAIMNKGKVKKHGYRMYSAHHVFWTEINANEKAADYFISHGYLSAWNYFDFPTY